MTDPLDPQQESIRRRLRQLAALPTDTSRLDRFLQAQLGVGPVASARPNWFLAHWRSLSAVAASLAALLTVALVLTASPSALHAEPTVMARLHADIVSGQIPMTRVGSIREASDLIARDWPDAPSLPTLPVDHDLACCLKDFEGRRVVCLVFEDDGTPISVVVASRKSLKSSHTPTAAVVHTSGAVNMVMKERDGRFICVMGKVPASRLLQLAEGFQF